ncbi:hypothetical protein DWB84_14345 [Saccharophagus sp. K07]|nr:hypothetical protein [Saccharophagus sp. K07]
MGGASLECAQEKDAKTNVANKASSRKFFIVFMHDKFGFGFKCSLQNKSIPVGGFQMDAAM